MKRVCFILLFVCVLVALSGCKTRTITKSATISSPNGKRVTTQTIWIWESEFWGSRPNREKKR